MDEVWSATAITLMLHEKNAKLGPGPPLLLHSIMGHTKFSRNYGVLRQPPDSH